MYVGVCLKIECRKQRVMQKARYKSFLIVSSKESLLWKSYENPSTWSQDIQQNMHFEVSIGLMPLILIIS